MHKNSKGFICILRHGFYPQDPRLFKEVRALGEAGYSVDILCLRNNGDKRTEQMGDVCVYRLLSLHRSNSVPCTLFSYLLSFLFIGIKVTIEYCKKKYCLIQVNTMPDGLVFAAIIPKLLGAKVLLDMHEPVPELWITKYGAKRHAFLLRIQERIEQWAIRFADQVITVNEKVQECFIKRGADKRKIDIVLNVPDELFSMNREEAPSPDQFTLITHGTIEPRYGHEVILQALPALGERIAGLKVYIVGDGGNKDRLSRLSEELGCSCQITLTGTIPFREVAKVISRADVGLVPLLWSPFGELCQPNKMFEYVALRRPVIASRLGAIENIFDDSCIMFFKPGDPQDLGRCILELYLNPARRRELAENAYRRYERIRWAETKKIYLKNIDALALKSPMRGSRDMSQFACDRESRASSGGIGIKV